MRVAVTGGAGFIGANLCRHLLARPEVSAVGVVDDLSSGARANLDGVAVEEVVGSILDGDVWSAEFLPKGGSIVACLGLAAVVWRGVAAGRPARAALVLLLALSMFVPCLYVTFLWNRLRYLWPFATGWFVVRGGHSAPSR